MSLWMMKRNWCLGVHCRCILFFAGKKLDDDKADSVPEVFIDQDEVLLKVCKSD